MNNEGEGCWDAMRAIVWGLCLLATFGIFLWVLWLYIVSGDLAKYWPNLVILGILALLLALGGSKRKK